MFMRLVEVGSILLSIVDKPDSKPISAPTTVTVADTIAPTTSATPSPAANASGWNKTNVFFRTVVLGSGRVLLRRKEQWGRGNGHLRPVRSDNGYVRADRSAAGATASMRSCRTS